MKRLLFILFIWLGIATSFAQTIVLDQNFAKENFNLSKVSYLESDADTLKISDVEKLFSEGKFKVNHSSYLSTIKANTVYWIRIPVHILTESKEWILQFNDPSIEHIEAYLPRSYGGFNYEVAGTKYPFQNRSIKHRNFSYNIQHTNDQQVYYFKIIPEHNIDLRISIKSINELIRVSTIEYFSFGLFYGFILLFSIYNLLYSFSIKDMRYSAYSVFLISGVLLFLINDGIGFQVFWSNYPGLNKIMRELSNALFSICGLFFILRIIGNSSNMQSIHKWIFLAIYARIILLVLFLLDPKFGVDLILLNVIYTCYTIMIIGYMQYKKFKPMSFILASGGILIPALFIESLFYFSIINLSFISDRIFQIAFLLQAIFLSFAIKDQLSMLRDDKEKALKSAMNEKKKHIDLMNSVNKMLEKKVVERTNEIEEKNKELAELNLKLADQMTQINKMNSALDSKNYKLKKDLSIEKNNRFTRKEISYDEFVDIFNDEITCWRYLEKFKWSKGFTCSKCNSQDYKPGTKKFSRRCTKCGYIENITANTPFHGVKFEIQKAFYLYYVLSSNKKIKQGELALLLSLRPATVSLFKKKINENKSLQLDISI
ncbi:7TM diverse intracellular signaling domain-containing protein [Aureibacter tunicatorum]|uniref:7TMR-DISM extracellular 2 n=1 Tax=Aureibacter tunicatorum TaxID=866807 RepID=A0AAE3XRS6_9BACT|nr:7TM diverse intracellular signaling domain-containing protein [Aureibacter tunicatorum]MDR6241430.1 hypothetical protein [Aureibacter tunicatorum]BDD06725.1 hypothetical protein AUTU_42080 [Aureibacter tunicatorum]